LKIKALHSFLKIIEEMNLKVRIAIISVAINALLVGVKFVLAGWSHSASILADAFHSLSDILVSLLVLSGLVLGALGQKRQTISWRKVEDVVAIVVGLFILLAAIQIFAGAITGPTRELARLPVALAGIFLCIVISGFIARLKIRVGQEQSSSSLVADGYHSRMDMYSSIGVMIGLVGSMIGLNLDVTAAGLIALLIAATGLEVIFGGIRALLRGTALEEYWLANLFGHDEMAQMGRIKGSTVDPDTGRARHFSSTIHRQSSCSGVVIIERTCIDTERLPISVLSL